MTHSHNGHSFLTVCRVEVPDRVPAGWVLVGAFFGVVDCRLLLVSHMVVVGVVTQIKRQGESTKAEIENQRERGEREVEEREVRETDTETDRQRERKHKFQKAFKTRKPGSREKAIVPKKG